MAASGPAGDTARAAVPGDQLVAAALVGIAVIVVLITWLKLHAFLSLAIGAIAIGAIAGWMSPRPPAVSPRVSATPWAASAF